MAQRWSDFVRVASLDGLEFDCCVSARDDFDRELDVQEIQNADGGPVEDRGGKHRIVELLATFANEDYPEKLNELLAIIKEGGIKELVHPIYGSLEVATRSASVTHDAEDARDAASLKLSFVVHTPPAEFAVTDTLPAIANECRAAAEDVTASADELAEVQVDAELEPTAAELAAPEAAKEAANAAADVATTLEVDGADLSVIDIQAQTNGAITVIDAVMATISNYTTPEQYALSRDLMSVVDALRRLAALLIEAKPPLIEQEILADIPFLEWVHVTYGSSERAVEVLALNSIEDPVMLRAGDMMRRYVV